jgi:hypothetical protein
MVSGRGGSRPASLSQRHVDALVRGDADAEALRLIAATRAPESLEAARSVTRGARPLEVTRDEIESIRRSGLAPETLVERIASNEAPRPSTAAGPYRAESPSAPTAEPPS